MAKAGHRFRHNIPITILLQLNRTLKKSLFSRKFYVEINEKVLARTSTLDASLYFICYFTLLLSSVLNNRQRIVAFLERQKSHLKKAINSFFFQACNQRLCSPENASAREQHRLEKDTASENNTLANGTNKPLTEEKAALPSKLADHLKAVSSYISDIRIFNRLVEAIKYMPWIIDEFAALMNPLLTVPRLDRLVNFAQTINCLVLELLENVGWLTDHNWIGTSDNSYWCIEAYIWCSRVWGAYILVEIIELFRRHPVAKRDKNWRINLFTQAVQLPLVLHWSLCDGCLTPFWVGLCGSSASWFGFKAVLDSIDLT